MSVQVIITDDNDVQYSADVMTIKRTSLGNNDHGIMDAWLHCEGDSTGIGVGGYRLDQPTKRENGEYAYHGEGTAYGLDYILQILKIVGVDSWEDLPGKKIYVLFNGVDGHWGKTAVGIANIDSGKVFNLQEHADSWKDKVG